MMTRDVYVIDSDATLAQGAAKMRSHDVGSLPVTENGRLVGVITDQDIAVRSVAAGQDPTVAKVRDAMTPKIIACLEDQDIKEAASMMRDNQIRRLVVLNRDRHLVGIVSLGDLSVRTGDNELSGEVLERVSEPGQMLDQPAAQASDFASAGGAALTKTIAGIFADRYQAQRALDDLRAAGLDPRHVGVITRDPERAREVVHETGGEVIEGAVAGLGMGAILGGAAGWLVGVGALAIPGIGPVIAAGPIAAALAVAGATAAVGAGAAATGLAQGRILLIAAVEAETRAVVEGSFFQHGADRIGTMRRT